MFILPGDADETEGCYFGWKHFNDKCYKIVTKTLPIVEAARECEKAGSQLASFSTLTQSFIDTQESKI